MVEAMASLLRQIVAGPRSRHPEAGLDLCYVTDNIIATSGPSSTYPQRAYRNPTDALVKFLDYKHGAKWAIWEFRAEGTGYPDSEVYNRIHHYPWPDHHPPPFALIPNIMASMREWLKGPEAEKGRVVVVHCKAGKGRSGTVACSYLVSEEGWTQEDALTRFTRRRMRSGFGSGVSIPSQLRWLGYVDWWSKHGKVYVERQIEILEVHVWGLRDGVKVAVEGYIEEGRVRKTFHTFGRSEKTVMEGEHNIARPTNAFDHFNEDNLPIHESNPQAAPNQPDFAPLRPAEISHEPGGNAVLFRPDQPTVLPTSDINIDFERRNKASYGLTMVTSVAHVWFNAFFESQTSLTSPNNATEPSNVHHLADSGVFEIDWEAMDGIKGSARKGTRALDRLAVLWRAVPETQQGLNNVIITEPGVGERVPESRAADWQNANIRAVAANFGKDLGLRAESSTSANVSKASSATDLSTRSLPTIRHDESGLEAGVEACGLGGEKDIPLPTITTSSTTSLPTIGRDEGCLEAGVKACGLHGEEHISQPTITTLEPSSLDYRSIDIEKKANSEVGLGMQKVHSPTASPGLKAISKDPLTSPEQISG